MLDLKTRPWWEYIGKDLQDLLLESNLLLAKMQEYKEDFGDYSFVVFPSAKAYEGFLKKLFLDFGFITEEEYYGKHFRIGKALNPNLEKIYRGSESVYDKLVNHCGGEDLANKLWDTWRFSRNLVFHWFPNEKNTVSLAGAHQRITMIIEAMDAAVKECKI
jgi:hypothetical protein